MGPDRQAYVQHYCSEFLTEITATHLQIVHSENQAALPALVKAEDKADAPEEYLLLLMHRPIAIVSFLLLQS